MHIFAPMKTFLSIVTVSIAGFVGLGMVFSDVVPVPVGLIRVVFGIGFYVVVGFVLAKWNSGWKLFGWAVVAGWGLGLLGIVGVIISISDPHHGDLNLAFLFLLGPIAAVLAGCWLGYNRGFT